ncbi:hypothetical protein HDU96_009789 [Phlyctochytrium bullatum]|nr:hypothetical protein HDU96_009789 [Phlyctochytrium bullatum]
MRKKTAGLTAVLVAVAIFLLLWKHRFDLWEPSYGASVESDGKLRGRERDYWRRSEVRALRLGKKRSKGAEDDVERPSVAAVNQTAPEMQAVAVKGSTPGGDEETRHAVGGRRKLGIVEPLTLASKIEYLRKNRYVRLDGFQYCKTLNNATFDALATLLFSGEVVAERNFTVRQFTNFVDRKAKDIMKDIILRNPALSPKLAVLLMAHGEPSVVENIKYLLKEMDDGSAIFLIHVDMASQGLHDALVEYIKKREIEINEINNPHGTIIPGNVFLAEKRYRGAWGSISLVWMELSGYWELLDLADWDYVINLSAHDVPLRKTREIYRILNLPGNKGKDFLHVEDNSDIGEMSKRLTQPHLPNRPNKDKVYIYSPKGIGLMYPPFSNWRVCKQHQWMILTRQTVVHFRTNKAAALALAFMEFSWIPDEQFFCYVLVNNRTLVSRVVNDSKHYLRFLPNEFHPKTIDINSEDDMEELGKDQPIDEPTYFFARKVEVRNPQGSAFAEWVRNQTERYLLPESEEAYTRFEGEMYVPHANDRPWERIV